MPRAGQQNGAWGLLGSLSQLCMNLGMGQRCESTFRPGAGQEESCTLRCHFCPFHYLHTALLGSGIHPGLWEGSAHDIHPHSSARHRPGACGAVPAALPALPALVPSSNRGYSSQGCPGVVLETTVPPWELGAEHWGSPISQPSSLVGSGSQGPLAQPNWELGGS